MLALLVGCLRREGEGRSKPQAGAKKGGKGSNPVAADAKKCQA